MSVTVTRFIEIRGNDGNWRLLTWSAEKSFASSDLNVSSNWVVNGHPHFNIYDKFSDNACVIRSFLNDQFDFYGTNFKDRGVPEDASADLKRSFAIRTEPGSDGYDYTYNHSYYTMRELEELYDRMLDKGWECIRREFEYVRSNEIIRKLNAIFDRQEKIKYKLVKDGMEPILPKEKKNKDKTTDDSLTYVSQTYYEIVDELVGIQAEIQNIHALVHHVANSWACGDDIRVTFYFS